MAPCHPSDHIGAALQRLRLRRLRYFNRYAIGSFNLPRVPCPAVSLLIPDRGCLHADVQDLFLHPPFPLLPHKFLIIPHYGRLRPSYATVTLHTMESEIVAGTTQLRPDRTWIRPALRAARSIATVLRPVCVHSPTWEEDGSTPRSGWRLHTAALWKALRREERLTVRVPFRGLRSRFTEVRTGKQPGDCDVLLLKH